jgi:integrase/recombinase XerD
MKKLVWKGRIYALDAPEGPLVGYIGPFERLLIDLGYPRNSARERLRLIAEFSVWLKANNMLIKEVTHESARRYLRYRAHFRRYRDIDAPALRRFVQLLQHIGVVAKETLATPTPIDRWVNEYSLYLHEERGLAATTIKGYAAAARLLLTNQPGTEKSRFSNLSAKAVLRFVQRKVVASRDQKRLTMALRSFLRYARYRGYIERDLAAFVPRVANWSMTSIPKAIAPDDARRVLASCDRRRAVGRRDYAMLLLLSRLGLRAGEVASLTLDDIDWDTGILTVHGKGAQESPFPLLAPVGEAIAAYLKHGRPRCESRRVFLRMQAPIRGFKTEKPVSAAVGRALARAGIDSRRRGAHQFRHALATHMLRQGSSLFEIGKILRHKNPNTTLIYAKADLTSLRTLAPSWPRA